MLLNVRILLSFYVGGSQFQDLWFRLLLSGTVIMVVGVGVSDPNLRMI